MYFTVKDKVLVQFHADCLLENHSGREPRIPKNQKSSHLWQIFLFVKLYHRCPSPSLNRCVKIAVDVGIVVCSDNIG